MRRAIESSLCCDFVVRKTKKTHTHTHTHTQRMDEENRPKSIPKTNEIQACPPNRSVPTTAPDVQVTPGAPWSFPRPPQKTLCVFGASETLAEEPPQPPGNPCQGPQPTPRNAQGILGIPDRLPETPEETPESQSHPQGLPGKLSDPPGTPRDPQRLHQTVLGFPFSPP